MATEKITYTRTTTTPGTTKQVPNAFDPSGFTAIQEPATVVTVTEEIDIDSSLLALFGGGVPVAAAITPQSVAAELTQAQIEQALALRIQAGGN